MVEFGEAITKGPSSFGIWHWVSVRRAQLSAARRFYDILRSSHCLPSAEQPHGAAARHCRLDNTPSAVPTGRRAGPVQPEIHDLPQRDHGERLVLSDARGCQSRGGRPRRARSVASSMAPRSIRPRAGNAEAYYPHFQFDSNYTYGMVHRE